MKHKAKKKTKPKSGKDPLILMNLKVTPKERQALNAQAKKYANGNLSAWLRYAGMNYRPSKSQLGV